MKKTIIFLLCIAMCISILVSCTQNSENNGESNGDEDVKKVNLTVWSPQEDQSSSSGEGWLNKMCSQFAKMHPEWDITFKFGVCSESDASMKIIDDPEGAADVYMFANDQLGTLLQAGAISKLGGKALEMVKTNNSDEIVKSVSKNGDVYGVPFTGNTWFMFYDKSVFTEEDVKSLDVMLSKGKVAFPLTTGWYTAAFYLANGGTMFGDGGEDAQAGIQFAGENGAEVTKYLIELSKNSNFMNDSEGSGKSGIINGSVGAIFSGTWDAKDIEEALGENFGAASLPTANIGGSAKQLLSFSGSKAIAANPHSDNPEVAVALAAYLGGTEAQKAHYEMRGIIPTDTVLLNEKELRADITAQAQAETLNKTSFLQPTIPEMTNYWVPSETMAKSILSGDVNLDNYKEKTEAFNKSLNGASLG